LTAGIKYVETLKDAGAGRAATMFRQGCVPEFPERRGACYACEYPESLDQFTQLQTLDLSRK